MQSRDNQKLSSLLSLLKELPKNIISLHSTENLTEFVLHQLCNERHFDLNRAAYFVDNPHFDHLKGIAGFSKHEAYAGGLDHWAFPDQFSRHMEQSRFNRQVRQIMRPGITTRYTQEAMQDLADSCAFAHPQYLLWQLKHENHGLLLFEQPSDEKFVQEHLADAVRFLGFCPVF